MTMRLFFILLAGLALCGCMTTARYNNYKAAVGDLGQQWRDEQDRALCTQGGVILGSLEYTKCRLDLNRKRIDKAKADAAKAAAGKTPAKKP
jgi:hypothetical protein